MNKATVRLLASVFCMTSMIIAEESAGQIITFSAKEVMSTSETGQMLQAKLQAEQDKLMTPIRKEAETLQKKEQKLAEKSKDEKTDLSALEFEKRELHLQGQKLEADYRKTQEQFGGIYQKEMAKFEQELRDVVGELGTKNEWRLAFVEEQAFWVNPKFGSKTSEIKAALDKHTKEVNKAKKDALAKKADTSSASSSSASSGSKK